MPSRRPTKSDKPGWEIGRRHSLNLCPRNRFRYKSVDLVVLDQGIDTTTLYGRLQFNILAAIGEFERELIKERSTEGRARAIARGVRFGAKPKLTKKEIEDLVRDYEAPGCSKKEIAQHYGISRSSVYRLYAENRQQGV